MIADSRITAVTLFSDRAEITRTVSSSLEAGEHTLVFDMLPDAIEESSVRVKGGGNAVLRGVQFRRVNFQEHPDVDIKELIDKKTSLEDSIGVLNDRISGAEKERGFVDDISRRLTTATEKSKDLEFEPEKWIRMVEFYRSKIDQLGAEIRSLAKERSLLEKSLNKVLSDISLKGNMGSRRKNQVEVSVFLQESSEITFSLVYLVYGPSWEPVYDLRVSTDEKKMSIACNAFIRQNTSEDWNDVSLKLSTARPHISGSQPELTPWRVAVYRPAPPLQPMARSAAKVTDGAEMSQMFVAEPAAAPCEEEMTGSEPDMPVVESGVTTGATSSVFEISGKSGVKSNNEKHRVTIFNRDFPAEFRYSSVPKLAQYAYLKAKVKNSTDFPMLAGASNVFLDNSFVANSEMGLVVPGEEFWTFLGVDEGMKISHSLINRYESKEGVFSKSVRIIYEYRITAKNNRKSEEELVIWDQIPVSGNDEIRVELVEPEYKKDSSTLKMNENKYLEWFLKPKPGEEIKLTLKFSVEYPRGITVTGL